MELLRFHKEVSRLFSIVSRQLFFTEIAMLCVYFNKQTNNSGRTALKARLKPEDKTKNPTELWKNESKSIDLSINDCIVRFVIHVATGLGITFLSFPLISEAM